VSVCLSVRSHISKPHVNISPNILYMLPVAVARSSSDGNATRYVLPVSCLTSCLHNGEYRPKNYSYVLACVCRFRPISLQLFRIFVNATHRRQALSRQPANWMKLMPRPFAPLCEYITPSTGTGNTLRTALPSYEERSTATGDIYVANWVKFGLWFFNICERTDRQRNRQTSHFAPQVYLDTRTYRKAKLI